MHFSRLLAAASTVALAFSAPAPVQSEKRATNLQFFGVNESGAEFGEKVIPGVKGKEYIWPNTANIDILIGKGMNTFRVGFLMERLIPTQMTGSLDAAYFADLKSTVDHITSKGAFAVLDPHNYMRYYGNVITDTTAFQAWWKTVASQFAGNSKVIFDCNNEPHDMPSVDLVVNLNQACINGIRSAGATSQYIFAEGTSWSGAHSWVSAGNGALSALTDPQNKVIYEMHQYLDSDSSGTSTACVSSTIGVERLQSATAWLRSNGKKGIIGEFAGGANSQCKTAVEGVLAHIAANSDVWTGALWWAAGPWWGDYMYSLEPTSGIAYNYYMDTLTKYAGNGVGSGSGSENPTPTTTVKPTTPTPTVKPTTSTTTVKPTTAVQTPTPTPTSGTGGNAVPKWGQCGGKGYSGSTVCVSGSTCTLNNEWYSQCL